MELRRYTRILLRRWPLIIVTVVVALAVGWAVAPHRATTYTASATVMIGPRSYTTGTGSNLPTTDQAAGLNTVVLTYTHLVDTGPVAEAAVQATGVPRTPAQVLAETTASNVQYTQLINVSVTDPSPQVAQALASAVASAFVSRVTAAPTPAAAGGPPAITAESFGPAGPPSASVPSGHKRDLAVAGIFGLLVAVALAVLAEYLDVTVKDPAEAERRLGAPLLATIPARPRPGGPQGRSLERAPAGAEIG